uniref:Uncharacterized protein n=1 Tax=Octopus bimaculoides TaxID=37653 RepID=A0A0L8GF13_OCTBM
MPRRSYSATFKLGVTSYADTSRLKTNCVIYGLNGCRLEKSHSLKVEGFALPT